jgi:hypothetical protein
MAIKIGRPALNLTNQKFGRLTALYLIQDRPLKRRWQCRCACGRTCAVDQSKLRSRETGSCGCLVHENALKQVSKLTLPPGTAFVNALFRSYCSVARKNKRKFTLSRHEFESKIIQPCTYCGAPPVTPEWAAKLRKQKLCWYNGTKAVNGLDRKDNQKGYTPENAVPCCRTCNVAKHTMSESEFLSWAHRVVTWSSKHIK